MEIVPIDKIEKCRICLEDESKGELIAPCACDGTIKYVHSECLNRWRFNDINIFSRTNCEICKKPYLIKRQYKIETFLFVDLYEINITMLFARYLLYLTSISLSAIIIYILDGVTNNFSLKMLTDNPNRHLLNIIKNKDICMLYYFALTIYIYNIFFHTFCIIFPYFYIYRKKLYLKKMILKYLLSILCNSYFFIFYPFFNIANRESSMYIYISLIFIFSFLSYPMNLIYLYNHDLTIKDMNEKNCNIVLNCSYNPMYEYNEEKTPTVENLININNIFEPRTDGIEMINETIQIPQPVQ